MTPRNSTYSPRKTKFLFLIMILGGLVLLFSVSRKPLQELDNVNGQNRLNTAPLVMQGGDPYIRALMRTISASESNVSRPYHVLYGGEYVADLSRHPEKCVPIVVGPNVGNCTTAAGRYQFLDFTWEEKAKKYHPKSSGLFWWKTYRFEAEDQDTVVYRWLSDPQAWGMNLSQQLRQGNLEKVLRLLSGTWTSLGYGIENNSMSPYLPRIYQKMLQEELSQEA